MQAGCPVLSGASLLLYLLCLGFRASGLRIVGFVGHRKQKDGDDDDDNDDDDDGCDDDDDGSMMAMGMLLGHQEVCGQGAGGVWHFFSSRPQALECFLVPACGVFRSSRA